MGESVWLWSTTASDNADADPSINYAEGQAPGTLNNSARAMMAAAAKLLLDVGGGLTTGGGATAYTVTTNQGLATPADGVMIHIVPHASNTGAATLNVDGTGAKALRRVTASGDAALAAGAMLKDGHYLVAYDASANGATGAWIVLNPESGVASVTVTGAGLATGGGDLTTNRVITVAAAAGADVAAGTATDKAITPDSVLDAMAWVALTYSSYMTINHKDGVNRVVTLAGNPGFGAPSNVRPGWPLNIWIQQDSSGSRVPTWNAAFDFGPDGAPVLSTGAGQADLVMFVGGNGGKMVHVGTRLRVD